MFSYAPYGYDELNLIEGTYFPSEQKNDNNYTYWYWFRSLFHRASSIVDIKLPESYSSEQKDFFYYCLFKFGYVAFFRTAELGTVFNPCTLNGFDFYYQPTGAIVTNPALKESLDLKLHENCELIRLTPDYLGIWDIIDYYAAKLANISCATDMTIENSKLAFVVAGKTKSARETLKKIFDKISKGVNAIVFDSVCTSPKSDIEPLTWLTRQAKDSYVGEQLLQDAATLLNMFDREIGIPTLPYEKKERLVDFESKSAIIDASSRLATWQKSLSESIAKVNAMFDLSITFDTRIDELYEILKVNDITSSGEGGDSNE